MKILFLTNNDISLDLYQWLTNHGEHIELYKKKLTIDYFNNNMFDLLIKREKESSTVIRPGLAIPHIIIKGRHKFDILLARCKQGILFPGVKSKVHIVFVLLGSKDERNFHLRALAAIAEIAQAKDFDKKWLDARDAGELRHIILLAERQRFEQ